MLTRPDQSGPAAKNVIIAATFTHATTIITQLLLKFTLLPGAALLNIIHHQDRLDRLDRLDRPDRLDRHHQGRWPACRRPAPPYPADLTSAARTGRPWGSNFDAAAGLSGRSRSPQPVLQKEVPT